MRFRQPNMHGYDARLGTKAEQRQTKGGCRPTGTEVRSAHRIESEVPATALKYAKAQKNGDRAQVRHHHVEKPGLANLSDAVLRRDQKVRRQCHGLPRQHKCVRVVGKQNEAHAGEKQVVLQTQKSRRGAFTLPEVASGKNRNASGCCAEQH